MPVLALSQSRRQWLLTQLSLHGLGGIPIVSVLLACTASAAQMLNDLDLEGRREVNHCVFRNECLAQMVNELRAVLGFVGIDGDSNGQRGRLDHIA